MRTYALIPAFNEENGIHKFVKETKNHVDKVIVCDDGSQDNTAYEAKGGGCIVIKHETNKGKGAALKTLFRYARESDGDVFVTIDGDGQFLPTEITLLVKPILENRADIVIGYRFDGSNEIPSYRKAGNKMLDKITNMASELPFRDTQSGFRAYSRKAIESINFLTDGFGADSEILIDASKKGLRILEEKVTVIYNTGQKTSTKNPISHTGEVISSLIELVALKHPLKYLGIPGLFLVAIGVYFGIEVISYFNATRVFLVPSTLAALGTIILGTILIMMAVVLFSIVRTSKRTRLD